MSDNMRIAASLYDALVTEAQKWACDDENDLAERLSTMPPAQALEAISENSLVPSDLYNSIVDAITELDPDTFASEGHQMGVPR
ncbi:hypothetical protein [Nocardia sp. IFM 10818]